MYRDFNLFENNALHTDALSSGDADNDFVSNLCHRNSPCKSGT